MSHFLFSSSSGTYLVFIGIAIVWGAFNELPKKQYGWFSIRLIVMVLMATLSNIIQYHHI